MTAQDDALGHLQAAAKEMISAARAMLDAAEDLVDNPETVGQLAGILTSFAKAAGGASSGQRDRSAASSDQTDEADDDGPDGVERIVIN